jgi:hypothetical protein
MKKLSLIIILLSITSLAVASTSTTGKPNQQLPGSSPRTNTLNNHTHDVEHPDVIDTRKEDEWGVGADIVVWENDNFDQLIQGVETQYKFDAANNDHQTYMVVKVNLWTKIKEALRKKKADAE